MFGYVRPFKGEMLVKEYDAYKGVYCQVCKAEISRETAILPVSELHSPADPVEENRVEASYGVSGSYDTVTYCSVCGKELSRETFTVPAPQELEYELREDGYLLRMGAARGGYWIILKKL